MSDNEWTVYIIMTRSGKLYTGITRDVARRFAEHLEGAKGAKFFRFDPPERIVFAEKCADRSAASKREAAIKQMSRRQKLALIDQATG